MHEPVDGRRLARGPGRCRGRGRSGGRTSGTRGGSASSASRPRRAAEAVGGRLQAPHHLGRAGRSSARHRDRSSRVRSPGSSSRTDASTNPGPRVQVEAPPHTPLPDRRPLRVTNQTSAAPRRLLNRHISPPTRTSARRSSGGSTAGQTSGHRPPGWMSSTNGQISRPVELADPPSGRMRRDRPVMRVDLGGDRVGVARASPPPPRTALAPGSWLRDALERVDLLLAGAPEPVTKNVEHERPAAPAGTCSARAGRGPRVHGGVGWHRR